MTTLSKKKQSEVGSLDLVFTPDTVTFDDVTGAKSTWCAFEFPDGHKGAVIITKIPRYKSDLGKSWKWMPVKDIKKIKVEFQ